MTPNRSHVILGLFSSLILFVIIAGLPALQNTEYPLRFDQPSDNLILHYPFDNTSTDIVKDHSSMNNQGTVKGGVYTSKGRFGPGMDFRESGAHIVVNSSGSLRPNALTVTTWIYPTNTTENGWIVANAYLGENRGFYLARNDDRAVFYVGTGEASHQLVGGELPANQWSHVVGVFGNGRAVLYVNGNEVESRNISGMSHPSRDIIIADNTWDPGSGARNFEGRIDEISMYDRPLTTKEVNAVYRSHSYDFPTNEIGSSLLPVIAALFIEIGAFSFGRYSRGRELGYYPEYILVLLYVLLLFVYLMQFAPIFLYVNPVAALVTVLFVNTIILSTNEGTSTLSEFLFYVGLVLVTVFALTSSIEGTRDSNSVLVLASGLSFLILSYISEELETFWEGLTR